MPLIKFQINDNLDVMVRISDPKNSSSPEIFLFISSHDQLSEGKILDDIKSHELQFFKDKLVNLKPKKNFIYVLNEINSEKFKSSKPRN